MAGSTTDRLSRLPDELLLHIFTFLHSSKLRAQTSILSRRFRHLWTHHPDLHLSMHYSSDPDESLSIARSFILAVDRALSSFSSPFLRSFSVDLYLPFSSYKPHAAIANRWLHFAGDLSVRNLSLTVRSRPGEFDAPIPSSLFCCRRSLEELCVMFCTFPAVPKNFRLSGFLNLKTLLIGCASVDDETLAELLECCPVLEVLRLSGCVGLDFVEVNRRNLPRVREVVLSNYEKGMSARVDAPNLEYLHFRGDVRNLDWDGSAVLTKANVGDKDGEGFDSFDDWMRIVCAVSNARLLKVNSWFFQFEIPKDFLNAPMFKNLKELHCVITWISASVARALTCNLGECPLLEKLYIELSYEERSAIKDSVQKANSEHLADATESYTEFSCFPHKAELLKRVEDEYEQDEWDPIEHFSESDSLRHLKTITFKEFLGSKNEMKLAAYFLRKAIVLEEFVVFDFLRCDDWELQMAFATIFRASSHVRMEISAWGNFQLLQETNPKISEDAAENLPRLSHNDAFLKRVEDEHEQNEWDPSKHLSELDYTVSSEDFHFQRFLGFQK